MSELSKLSPESAWQQLLGTWIHRTENPGGWTESKLEFTLDRKWIRTNSLGGGVVALPPNTTTTEIVDIAVDGDRVLISLGESSSPLARSGVTMPVRFPDPDHLRIEDGMIYARVADE